MHGWYCLIRRVRPVVSPGTSNGGLGHTGTAFPLMLLIAALENAHPGDRRLLVSYGDGCDVFSFQRAVA